MIKVPSLLVLMPTKAHEDTHTTTATTTALLSPSISEPENR
jgi:hypothetical protein